jgi:hypothetical protein
MRIPWICSPMRLTRTFAADGIEVEHLSGPKERHPYIKESING